MRAFLDPRATLATLPEGLKLAYSAFLAFSLAGYGVMVALALEKNGFSATAIADAYAGGGEHYARTRGELLELTHFHLFAMPLFVFVEGHVFFLTRWPRRVKLAFFAAACLGIALDLAAPWLVIGVSRDLAWVKLAARALFAPAFLAFAFVPLYEMWLAPRRPDPPNSASSPQPTR